MLHDNTLNEILVFDLSVATGLYALTNYVGKIWALDIVVSAEAFMTSATERRAPDWTGRPTRLGLLPAKFATCRCAMGDGPRPLRA